MSKYIVAVVVALGLSATARADEMDQDRAGRPTPPAPEAAFAPFDLTALAAATELDRETPSQAWFVRRWGGWGWGWGRPWGWGWGRPWGWGWGRPLAWGLGWGRPWGWGWGGGWGVGPGCF
jgi:hypothetical protein